MLLYAIVSQAYQFLGGELFDHILAHRYLKDRDASKLFAQLISGVAYLHAKKIIHRDLKLENLLLDRNRNIIITDFGFANRYEEKGNDLMATSCGSPCYAAPELVVQDGKYVGSAVDVWSCGVILYAMLAGYLPFDDDPLNPDSENINLLYKYIINTPLSFPEWITPEPRDLLQKMLVPDPNKRCTLQDVAQHRWLRKYASLFDRTVEDLEGLAADQDEIKRQMLERQRDAVLYQEQAAHMTRSQTTAGMRPQSAMVTSSSMQASFAPSASASTSGRPGPSTSSNRRAHAYSAIVVPTVASQPEPVVPAADPFAMSSSQSHSAIPMSVSVSAPPRAETEEEQYQAALASQQDRKRIPSGEQEMPKAKSQRTATPDEAEEREKERKSKAKAHRYTVQVEYVPEQTSTRDLSKDAIMEQPVQTSPLPLEEKSQAVSEPAKIKELPEPIATVIEEPTPAESSASLVPSISVAEDHSPTSDSAAHSFDPPQSAASSSHADLGHSSSNLPPQPLAATVLPEKSTTPPASPKAEEKRPEKAVPFPPSPEQKRSKPLNAPAANEQVQRTASNSSRPPSSAASVSSKHRKAGSSDRFSISRFLGGSTTSLDKQARRGPLESSTASAQKEPFDEVTNKRKGGRRKAFSLVVEPFKPASSGASVRSGKRSSVRVQEGSSGSTSSRPTTERPRTRSSVALETTPAQGAVMSPPPRNLAPSITSTRRDPSSASTAISTDPSWVSSGPPAGKAKRVMDWFRWKSMPRDSGLASSQGPSAISTDFDRNTNLSASSRVTRASAKRQENLQHDQPAPSLVVTQTPADEPTGLPASPSTVTSLASQAPVTQAPVSKAPAASERPGPLIPVTDVQRAASVASNRTGSLEAFTEARLRFHQGAVDQNALTYRHPPAVLIDIRKILWAMGIDVREEAGPFRLKCTRRSSKKVAASHGVSVNAVTSGSLASSLGPGSLGNSTSIGPASSERLDGRTGLPASPHMGMTSSPSSTFKAFFGRRSSTNSVHQQAGMPSPALSTSTTAMDSPDLLLSPPGTSSATMGDSVSAAPLPYYGKTDSGAEVRFTVELSRMKNLPKLYAVDVRRLKGELWAYRGVSLVWHPQRLLLTGVLDLQRYSRALGTRRISASHSTILKEAQHYFSSFTRAHKAAFPSNTYTWRMFGSVLNGLRAC